MHNDSGTAVARKVPMRFIPLDEPHLVALYERRLVLVRPDGHVAWRDDAAPADPLAVIDRVRGDRKEQQREARAFQ